MLPGNKKMKNETETQSFTEEEGENGCIISSGNIFADMLMPDAEERLAKAELSIQIENLINARKLTQTQAAALMGLTQPNVSDIVRGRLKGFTLDRLFACLNALDQDIEIVVRPKEGSRERGRVIVSH